MARPRPFRGRRGGRRADELRRAFVDRQTERTPPRRVTLERCVDAFLAHSEAQGRSPNTLRTYRQIAAELKSRWQGWRIVDVDVDFDELEDYRDELAERGLAGSTLNQRRAALPGVFERARRDQDLYDAAAILTAPLCGLRRSGLLGRRWRAVPWARTRSSSAAGSPRSAATACPRVGACARSRCPAGTRPGRTRAGAPVRPQPNDRVFRARPARR